MPLELPTGASPEEATAFYQARYANPDDPQYVRRRWELYIVLATGFSIIWVALYTMLTYPQADMTGELGVGAALLTAGAGLRSAQPYMRMRF